MPGVRRLHPKTPLRASDIPRMRLRLYDRTLSNPTHPLSAGIFHAGAVCLLPPPVNCLGPPRLPLACPLTGRLGSKPPGGPRPPSSVIQYRLLLFSNSNPNISSTLIARRLIPTLGSNPLARLSDGD